MDRLGETINQYSKARKNTQRRVLFLALRFWGVQLIEVHPLLAVHGDGGFTVSCHRCRDICIIGFFIDICDDGVPESVSSSVRCACGLFKRPPPRPPQTSAQAHSPSLHSRRSDTLRCRTHCACRHPRSNHHACPSVRSHRSVREFIPRLGTHPRLLPRFALINRPAEGHVSPAAFSTAESARRRCRCPV